METQRALVNLVQAKKPSIIFLSETLAQQHTIENLTQKLGFTSSFCVDHEQGSRGLAILWNVDTHVDIRNSSANHIDTIVGKPGAVGGGGREHTWNLIRTLADQPCDLPWLMAGDFNEVMWRIDESGGNPRASAAMTKFRRAMTYTELNDMGYVGGKFTWYGPYTKERLDRGFQSHTWKNLFPSSRVITLPLSESDHCPLLIEVMQSRQQRQRRKKLYRFDQN